MVELTSLLKAFIAIFVLINPLEGIPFYLQRTYAMTPEKRRAIAHKAGVAVLLILLVSLATGQAILATFGITQGAFQSAGGIIIFLISLKMVLGPAQSDDQTQPAAKPTTDSFAIVPLAIPLLAGPGPIGTVIVYAASEKTWDWWLGLTAVVFLASAATYASLLLATPIGKRLGPTGIDVATRISGLLVSAIAIEMVASGIKEMLPALAATPGG